MNFFNELSKNYTNLSEKEQREEMTYNGLAIKYIDNPTEAVQLEAVKENKLSIKYISNPS